MEKIDKVDQAIAEAIEEFKNLVDDPENHEEFLWREKQLRDKISFLEDARDRGLKEGREEGLKQGIQEGIQKGIQQGIQQGMQQGMQKGIQKGIKEGHQEGLQEGIKQNQEKVVINMYNKKIDIDTICEVVNLNKNEVEKIINKQK